MYIDYAEQAGFGATAALAPTIQHVTVIDLRQALFEAITTLVLAGCDQTAVNHSLAVQAAHRVGITANSLNAPTKQRYHAQLLAIAWGGQQIAYPTTAGTAMAAAMNRAACAFAKALAALKQ